MSKLALNGGEKAIKTPKPHEDWPITTEREIEAVKEYLESGGQKSFYGHGDLFKEFEEEFSEYHDGEQDAILTNTGTSALNSAYFGVGLEPGDEVITPSYTFLATVSPILQNRAVPRFADSLERNGNIDPESVKEQVNSDTEAIAVTHMWGHPVEIDAIMDIAEDNDLKVIEDCSHAHGAEYNGKKVGTFGDAAAFSLGSTKIVSGGELGILLTQDDEIYDRASVLGHFRKRADETVKSDFYQQFTDFGYGQNYRPHPLAVVMAREQFDNMDEWINSRKENLQHLTDGLEDVPGVKPPVTDENVDRGAFYGYKPEFVPEDFDGEIDLETYIEALQAEGMKVKRPGSKPLHTLEFFQTYNDGLFGRNEVPEWWRENKNIYAEGDFPGAESYFENRLSLPTFTLEDRDVVDEYINAFQKVYDNRGEL
ncbi:MAG: DegT/DnrJ/EryC1/StrS family aminotransferase [Candidatus Nanohaloarchaea archaeon]